MRENQVLKVTGILCVVAGAVKITAVLFRALMGFLYGFLLGGQTVVTAVYLFCSASEMEFYAVCGTLELTAGILGMQKKRLVICLCMSGGIIFLNLIWLIKNSLGAEIIFLFLADILLNMVFLAGVFRQGR